MHQPKNKPEPARVSGSRSNTSTSSNYISLASIRRRYGRGIPAYERAKTDWKRENPTADPGEYTAAMRKIARAVKV